MLSNVMLRASAGFSQQPELPALVVMPLRWARPEGWETWQKLYVQGTSTTDEIERVFCGGKPTQLIFPKDRVVPPVRVEQVRDCIVIGGSIKALDASFVNGTAQYALYFPDGKGTIHIEGMEIDCGGLERVAESDAFQLNGKEGIFQVQNCRAMNLHGSEPTNHADVIQTFNGMVELRVHNLTGSTDYQGIKFQLINGTTPAIHR